jgi:plasmid stabilization system protein ParE
MSYRLVISDHARDQLEAACRWWAENRSVEQAERWYDGFSEALLSLPKNPERCPFAAESSAFPFDVRQLNYGIGRKLTHRALFTVRGEIVYVFSVRHLAQKPVTPDDL